MSMKAGGGGMNMDMQPTRPSNNGGGMAMMHTAFFWGSHVEILFTGWPGDRGVGIYIVALILVFTASFLLEALSSLTRRPSAGGCLLTIIHAFRMGLAYLVMLAVMSFNMGVFIAAIAGHALGFLVWGRAMSKGVSDK